MKAGLTKRQKEVLDAIRALTVEGVAPTYDEIAERVGMRSRGHVSAQLVILRNKGRIAFEHKARSIRIIEDGQPAEPEIETASPARLRAVIEDAVEALAVQIGHAKVADILALVLENRRRLARIESGAPSSPRRQPQRSVRGTD